MFDFMTPFYLHYYNSRAWMDTYWMGHPVYKCPLDLFLYQEILFTVKPDIIVECGTNVGGSALYLAQMCDLMNKGRIITVDIVEFERTKHDRITYLTGDSASVDTFNRIKQFINSGDVVLVILDSDHTEQHVYKELMLYHQLVTVGSYVIVEDTILGHPVYPELLPGPMEAVARFLPDHDEFRIDKSKHKFHLTFNPNGYLQRVK
ncbi:CmcI family methyltransferase [Paenibacillus taiwanensis]|uniref:CmcI family methyltransferase n=1 Tax=Paenibacillus taiwanensis TaxID=401638 RepID=UPI000429AECA|nr:CmcI family methyltransferase [Paenibacillus taiwanensis]